MFNGTQSGLFYPTDAANQHHQVIFIAFVFLKKGVNLQE